LFFIAIIMSRTVNEAGLLHDETSFLPQHLMHLFYPLHSAGPASLTMGGMLNVVFIRDLRGVLLSPLMDNQKDGGRNAPATTLFVAASGSRVVVAFRRGQLLLFETELFAGQSHALRPIPMATCATSWGRTAEAVNGGTIAPGATEYAG
jgi:hypothetical protein